ncbi:UvrD-helicase domain-containing protein [Dermabacter vaginalis]|uniref:UvrD-helicase domain-containing protein n=1 Tax=Dermabacter vaginalis TaxID=1630135 RepID=UPI001EF4241E|nr:UvrD-helicase domain-containing protein [Dermabacter vaginalis]MCG7444299.1 UvrD-helicase domain-containing protein [Dermabacter vaginalis]
MTFTVITASAGSGKTYTLTTRLADALAGGVRTSEIIATTFTTKAAAELRERLQVRLIELGHVDQANEIGSALIGTVNSIAGSIVQDYAIDMGLSPELRVLSEDESERLLTASINHMIADIEEREHALLARLGYDEAPGQNANAFQREESWAGAVGAITRLARTNGVQPSTLMRSAEESIAAFRAMIGAAGYAIGGDERETWLRAFASCLSDLTSDLDAARAAEARGEEFTRWPSDGEPAKRLSSTLGNVEGSIVTLEALYRRMSRDVEAVRWKEWMALADVTKVRPAHGGKKPGARPAAVFAPLADLILGASDGVGFLGNEAFVADVEKLIRLAFSTAAHALHAYAEHKAVLGVMDFADQETLALDLVTHNERVRSSLRDRFRFLAVDEFQDTSPIQLELFMRLGDLVDDVVWVGDQKQSIYGFRDAAPELMESVVDAVREKRGGFAGGSVEALTDSYRSSEPPLSLTNALFTSIFRDMEPSAVALNIPKKRERTRHEGGVELWKGPENLPRAKDSALRSSIATGIHTLLTSGTTLAGEPVMPGDIAVLARGGGSLSTVTDALESLGIPTTGAERNLWTGREAHFMRAGLASLLDPSDTLALAELVSLIPEHASHECWFQELGALPDTRARQTRMEAWREDQSLAALEALRARAAQLSPSEIVLALIDALELPRRAKQWSATEDRLAVLEAFHALARTYEDDCASRGRAMGLAGLKAFLEEHGEEHKLAHNPNAVTVSTIHGAKGLQWPVVITVVPEKAKDARNSVTVKPRPAEEFDAEHPLEGRALRFIPIINDSFPPMAKALAHNPDVKHARLANRAEEARIHYVALTRAKYQLVLAGHKDLTETLYAHFSPEILEAEIAEEASWTPERDESAKAVKERHEERDEQATYTLSLTEESDGSAALTVTGARVPVGLPGQSEPPCSADACENAKAGKCECGARVSTIPVTVRHHETPEELEESESPLEPYRQERSPLAASVAARPAGTPSSFVEHESGLPARFAASAVASVGIDANVTIHAKLGAPLVGEGGEHRELVGEAVHAYLATPYALLPRERQLALARRITERWLGTDPLLKAKVTPEVVIEAGERWHAWSAREFPGHTAGTEVPVAWWNADGQAMEGWIDSLLTLENGHSIVVDHKTNSRTDPVQVLDYIRKEYVGQLATYMSALEERTGRRPEYALVHLPLSGYVVKVEIGS